MQRLSVGCAADDGGKRRRKKEEDVGLVERKGNRGKRGGLGLWLKKKLREWAEPKKWNEKEKKKK